MLKTNRSQARLIVTGVAVAAAGLGLLAGCGADGANSDPTSTGPAGAEPAGAEPAGTGPARTGPDEMPTFTDLFTTLHTDYEPVGSPAALAAESTLVVEGRIGRVDQGRRFGTSAADPVASSTVVLVFEVTRVWHGSMPAGAGDTVYVELPAPGSVEAQVFDQAAPKDHDALLYLAPAAEPDQTAIVDPAAGRPAGQPLFQPTNPQGFLVQGETEVLQILGHTAFPGSNLEEFLPTSPRFPTLAASSHHD